MFRGPPPEKHGNALFLFEISIRIALGHGFELLKLENLCFIRHEITPHLKRIPVQKFKDGTVEIACETHGRAEGPVIVWAHGWGQNRIVFQKLAESMETLGRHVLIDFPGFGDSPLPPEVWGTEDYADSMARMIQGITQTPVIWVGHSFGCRVGIQLAARHPNLVAGLFLVAAAGLPRRRSLAQTIYIKLRVLTFKSLKKLIPIGLINQDWLYKTFGSSDYRRSGPLRAIFIKVVNEDLSKQAQKISCPTALVYGTNDTETPLEIGERLNALIHNSELTPLAGFDHYTVLSDGRHQLALLLKRFLEKVKPVNV
jgi:pimeloyl-ACP methyl ester carboxylesterase